MSLVPVVVLPAPRIEPPYDDELAPEPWLAGTLQQLPFDLTQTATSAPVILPVVDPVPTSEARRAAHRFLAISLEVLDGYRPPGHLRPLTSPLEFTRVADEIARAARRGSPPPRVRLRELRVCEPRPGIAEIAAVVGRGSRRWAMAVRLERRQSRWLCTTAVVI
ncbi:MAG TPA: Rv3235 family protein [Micromonosporaceae bacterium]|nr:Rv3235 family protein [Micromonosporaceae bacterium]